jgi:hypothetical protein
MYWSLHGLLCNGCFIADRDPFHNLRLCIPKLLISKRRGKAVSCSRHACMRRSFSVSSCMNHYWSHFRLKVAPWTSLITGSPIPHIAFFWSGYASSSTITFNIMTCSIVSVPLTSALVVPTRLRPRLFYADIALFSSASFRFDRVGFIANLLSSLSLVSYTSCSPSASSPPAVVGCCSRDVQWCACATIFFVNYWSRYDMYSSVTAGHQQQHVCTLQKHNIYSFTASCAAAYTSAAS